MSNAIEILKSYDVIFSDVFGVIHDGINILPNVHTTFSKLLEMDKKVVLISNAPRQKKYLTDKFNSLGLGFLNDLVVTSGDFFRYDYLNKGLPIFNGKGFIFGKEVNTDLTAEIGFNEAEHLEEADFILILNYADHISDLEKSFEFLKKAAYLGLPAICPNPDKIATHGASLRYTAGKFAEAYEQFGGKTTYYGKPFKNIFQFASAKFSLTLSCKAIMIGDSLETDVRGAEAFGIDSLLLLTGITKKGDLERAQYEPTYFLNHL